MTKEVCIFDKSKGCRTRPCCEAQDVKCCKVCFNYDKCTSKCSDDAITINKWIPCSEQMPPDKYDGETIIFTSIDEEGNYYTEAGYYDKEYNQCVNENYWPSGYNFIAWMLLPEPFREV